MYPLTSITWLYQVSTHPGRVFFEVIRWQVKSFQIIEGSSMFFKFHMKYGVFMSLWPRTIKIVISNWPWTRKFSQIFLIHSGKTDAFHFCHHSHALVTRKTFRKTFRKLFSYNFGCRKKALSDFLASSSSLKTVNTRKPAKSFKLKLKDSGFLETL